MELTNKELLVIKNMVETNIECIYGSTQGIQGNEEELGELFKINGKICMETGTQETQTGLYQLCKKEMGIK